MKEISPLNGIDTSGLDPAETYIALRNEFQKITNINELIAFAKTYGTDNFIQTISQLSSIKYLLGEEAISSIILTIASENIKSAEILSVSDRKATIRATSENNRIWNVNMIYIQGSWKIDSESSAIQGGT